jgi:hypothetical protein
LKNFRFRFHFEKLPLPLPEAEALGTLLLLCDLPAGVDKDQVRMVPSVGVLPQPSTHQHHWMLCPTNEQLVVVDGSRNGQASH